MKKGYSGFIKYFPVYEQGQVKKATLNGEPWPSLMLFTVPETYQIQYFISVLRTILRSLNKSMRIGLNGGIQVLMYTVDRVYCHGNKSPWKIWLDTSSAHRSPSKGRPTIRKLGKWSNNQKTVLRQR